MDVGLRERETRSNPKLIAQLLHAFQRALPEVMLSKSFDHLFLGRFLTYARNHSLDTAVSRSSAARHTRGLRRMTRVQSTKSFVAYRSTNYRKAANKGGCSRNQGMAMCFKKLTATQQKVSPKLGEMSPKAT